MASRSGISKLTLPTDIGEEERILSYRQKIIEGKLLKCYAEEVSTIISMLVLENCEGCRIDHLSQGQHDCLMIDTALEKVSEAKVVETFVNSLQDLKPSIYGLELLKYTCQDWRKLCCTKNRGILKRQTLGIICDNIEHIYLKSINF